MQELREMNLKTQMKSSGTLYELIDKGKMKDRIHRVINDELNLKLDIAYVED